MQHGGAVSHLAAPPQRRMTMTSLPVRSATLDHLLTPQNSALILIDYQPVQVRSIKSMDRELLVQNIVRVARTATTYGLPIVLSTMNVLRLSWLIDMTRPLDISRNQGGPSHASCTLR